MGMEKPQTEPLMSRVEQVREHLTPKGRILGEFVLGNPRRAVYMTIKDLAAACGVSEATVVRFVSQLAYDGYGDFHQALREMVDTGLTLLDRVDIQEMHGTGAVANRFQKAISEEIDNLKLLYKSMDTAIIEQMVDLLEQSPAVYVVGSRISYTYAYFMGWSLMRVRPQIQILKGSDTTTLDALTVAPAESLVVIIATSRYPNELIRVGKQVRRLGHRLVVMTDSSLCPLIQFAHLRLIAPSQHIPVIGNPNTLSCLVNFIVLELVRRNGNRRKHQERLEQFFLENDIFFNLHARMPEPGPMEES